MRLLVSLEEVDSTADLPSRTLITLASVVGLTNCGLGSYIYCFSSIPKIGAYFHLWSFDSIFGLLITTLGLDAGNMFAVV